MSLAEERPDLARQWIFESNGNRTPQSVLVGSHFKAAWRCGMDCKHCGQPHEWRARVAERSSRTRGSGCPFCCGQKCCECQSLAAKHPDLMKQWDWKGNQDIDPCSVGRNSGKRISWVCPKHGQWHTTPSHRVNDGQSCPVCARQRREYPVSPRRLVKEERPKVYAELHPTKNRAIDTAGLTCGMDRRVWWLCQRDECRPLGCQHEHAWEARVETRCKRRNPSGCPFCSGHRVCPCNSLAEQFPALMQYWDFAGNTIPLAEPLDPNWIGPHSTKKVWWRHDCGDGQVHYWRATPSKVVQRVAASGRVPCPGCAAAVRAATRAATFDKRRQQLVMRR